MPNPKYDVIFEGRYVEGADPAKVRSLIGQIFKVGREDAGKLFSGRCIVIKRGLDLPEAHRFKNLMRKAGAGCRLVPQNAPLLDQPKNGPPGPARMAAPDPTLEVAEQVTPGETGSKMPAAMKYCSTSEDSTAPGRYTGPGASGLRRGIGRGRKMLSLLAALAVVALVGIVVLWPEKGPMPADTATLETFVACFNRRLLEVRAGRSRAVTHVRVAKAVVEEMGYDYDQTLLYWRFNQALSKGVHRRQIRDVYLIGPLKVLFELDTDQMKSILAPETCAALEDALGIDDHVTLQSIRMLRECARGATRIEHEALVAGLRKFDIAVDPNFPEMSVKEAFYGLHHHELIQIRKSWEWKVKRVELEILDRERIADQEKKLLRLESLMAQYTPNAQPD